MIVIRYTKFNCPSCGAHWADRMVTSPVVGPEWTDCKKCKFRFRTPDIEWDHMSTGQKAGYLFRETTIAWLIFCAIFLTAGLLLMQDGYTPQEQRESAAWVIGITVLLLMPSTLGKWWAIRRSKQRVTAVHEQKQQETVVVSSSR